VDLQKKLYEAEVELTRELAYLKSMEQTLPRMLDELNQVKTACDNESLAIEDELKGFAALKEQGGKSSLAEVVVPVDGFSEQGLKESARRDAYDDVMYELMKRINTENCDSVMKLIRNAACDQFTSVALLAKMGQPDTVVAPPLAAGGHIRSSSSIAPH